MDENENSQDILQEQEEKKQKALQELKELQSLLHEEEPEQSFEDMVQPEPPAAPIATEEPPAAPASEVQPPQAHAAAEEETVLLESNLFQKIKEQQKKQEEAERRERIRRTSSPRPAAEPPKQSADSQKATEKSGVPRPARKITRKEAERRRRARQRQRIILVAGLCVLAVLVVAAAAFSIHKSNKASQAAADTGSAAVTDSAAKKEENTVDTSLPASQQQSKQYLAIKDDTTLPSYAKEYPGLYSDARDVTTEESAEKVCYLTFDDGPSESVTPSVLDTLKKYDVQATFFVVASQISGNEALVQRMVDEGHSLCVHAYVHDYESIYASVDSYLEDFAQAYDAIYAATGYRVQGFRFPGGSNNGYLTSDTDLYDAIVTEMTRRGFEYYDWNAYDGDAEGSSVPEPSSLSSRAVEEVQESSRDDAILLMHDTYGKENTASALPGIIQGLQSAGIEMLPLTNTSRPVHFEVDDSTPSEYSGVTEDTAESETSGTTADTAQ